MNRRHIPEDSFLIRGTLFLKSNADIRHLLDSLVSDLVRFTPPRLGLNVPWNEPAFACCGSYVIQPQFDEIFRQETIIRFKKQQQQQR